MGVSNGIVSSQKPDVLCPVLKSCFDKVLVDAPCSGEGMIRKDNSIIKDWTKENVLACAVRQEKILDVAADCVRDGGILVYSTCTFAREENEKNVKIFLEKHPEFSIIPSNVEFGRQGYEGLKETRRILWQDGGEGHFVAKFKKAGDSPRKELRYKGKIENDYKLFEDLGLELPVGLLIRGGDKLYLAPDIDIDKKLGVLRAGIYLGEYAKNRFIPSHCLYANPFVKAKNTLNLELGDKRIADFLHGEEIWADSVEKGYCRVSIEGIPCSFGKFDGQKLKNHYPKGLRTLKKDCN